MKKFGLLILIFFSISIHSQEINILSNIENNIKKTNDITIKSAIEADFEINLLESTIQNFILQLPNGESIVLEKLKLKKQSNKKFSWFGSISGEADSSVNFAIVDESISGSIFTSNHVFEIFPLGNKRVRIMELNSNKFDACDGGVYPQNLSPQKLPMLAGKKSNKSTSMDVLIVYSNDALTTLGTHAAVESLAQAAINNMNTSLANSLLSAGVSSVNLVATIGINRDESGDSSTELSWLANDANVLSLRNQYGADLVSMITSTTGCGIGYVMTNPGAGFSESAFQVTRYNCAVGNLTMAHEFGHNLGLEHNPENSSRWPNGGSYPYSYAQYHDGVYRTVMSYSSPCTSGCTRKMYYSNPDVIHLGLSTGVDDEKDNTRSLEQTTLFAVDFRTSASNIFANGFEN